MTIPDTTGLLGLISLVKDGASYHGTGPIAGFPFRFTLRRADPESGDLLLAVHSGTSDQMGPLPAVDGWGYSQERPVAPEKKRR